MSEGYAKLTTILETDNWTETTVFPKITDIETDIRTAESGHDFDRVRITFQPFPGEEGSYVTLSSAVRVIQEDAYTTGQLIRLAIDDFIQLNAAIDGLRVPAMMIRDIADKILKTYEEEF